MSKTVEIKRKSVLPLYIAAAVFLVCCIALPVYRLWALLVAAGLGAIGYGVARRICPDVVEVKEIDFFTGKEDADEMLRVISDYRKQLKNLNDRIPDDALSVSILRMENACDGILQKLEQNPENASTVRRFTNHYLPDAVKILSLYAELTEQKVQGENTANVQREVEQNAAVIATAFEHQLDTLYANQALDISTDLDVLKGMLKGQGLV